MNSLALVVKKPAVLDRAGEIRNLSRILHEYDHFVRILGTPYGLLRYGFQTQYLEYFIRALRVRSGRDALSRDWQKVGKKVSSAMTTEAFATAFFGDSAFADIYRGQCMLEAIKTLDGHNLMAIGIDAIAGWGYYLSKLCGDWQNRPSLLSARLEQLWGRQPEHVELVLIDGAPLRVHDMLEYLGVVVELASQKVYGLELTDFPEDLSKNTYLQVLNVIKAYLPHLFDLDTLTMAQEIECLIELALWIPVWPGMSAEDLPEHAIHLIPSHRLGLILKACQKLALPFRMSENHGVEDVTPVAQVIQSEICRALNWKEPIFIAQKWHDFLGGLIQQEAAWSPLFFHHPRSQRTAWSKQLVLEFGNEPVSGPMLAAKRHYHQISFPILFDLHHRDQGYYPNDKAEWPDEDRHFQLLDLLLFSASGAALDENQWAWLPKKTQLEAEETWQRLIGAEPF